MEWVLHSKTFSSRVITSVFTVAFGVGVCTVTDVDINGKGFLCACVAVICTSLQQIVSSAVHPAFLIFLCNLLELNSFHGVRKQTGTESSVVIL